MFTVSVVIPTYNRAHTLKRAIDSVLAQSYYKTCRNFELIVVDDASTDDTGELLATYGERIKVITAKSNGGVSAARNLGVAESSGEWIAFLDSDDQWLPHKLEAQLKLLRSSGLHWVHGEEIWIKNGVRVNPAAKHKKCGGDIFERSLALCLVSPSTVVIRRDILLQMGGFDESFVVCEDYDLWLKMASAYEVAFVSDPIIVKYGGHEDQLSKKFKAMDYFRVRALENILKTRTFTPGVRQRIVDQIIEKSRILRNGYIKHNNTSNLAYIESLLSTYKVATVR